MTEAETHQLALHTERELRHGATEAPVARKSWEFELKYNHCSYYHNKAGKRFWVRDAR